MITWKNKLQFKREKKNTNTNNVRHAMSIINDRGGAPGGGVRGAKCPPSPTQKIY